MRTPNPRPRVAALVVACLLAPAASAAPAWAQGDDVAQIAPTPRESPSGDSAILGEKSSAQRPDTKESRNAGENRYVPITVSRELYRMLGKAYESLALSEEARDAYSNAITEGADTPEIWRGLGRMRVRSGDFEGAEAAFLAAFEQSLGRSTPAEDTALGLELAELYLIERRPADAETALEGALLRDPASPRLLQLLGRARSEQGSPSAMPEAVVLFAESRLDARRARVEDALRGAAARLPPPLRRALEGIARQAIDPVGRRALLATIGLLLLARVAVRRARVKGDLGVTIAYPAELIGSFSVRLATQPGRYKRPTRAARTANAALQHTRASTKAEHFGVSRETHFRGLRARNYYVTLEGILHDPHSNETVADPFDEQLVRLQPGRTVHLDFDVVPRESVVDVRVVWDKQPARDSAITARGLPQSLRYARDGTTKLRLPHGSHTIIVGGGDRVAERQVQVDSFRAASLEIDLGNSEHLIFKGCPPAVEPYLAGDVATAARALERDGHGDLANALLGVLCREQGQHERAAGHFERGGKLLDAAQLYAGLERFEDAARLYQQIGDFAHAGDMLRETGDLVRAGDCFERAREHDKAIACFELANDIPRLIDAVEHAGNVFGAARLAVEHADQARVIRLLQQISTDHSDYPEACQILVSAYLSVGHRDLAVRKLEEQIEAAGPGAGAPALEWQLAGLLEEDGDYDHALDVLSRLRERDPLYPNIATSIEGLRKKQTERRLADSAGHPASGSGSRGGNSSAAPTAFLATSRYEILGEIGRGGMGVVLKARDTRLERIVALKRLPETLRDHPKAIALFLREAQSAARLNHPNIVTVYDTDQEDGNFFITMELLEGAPLGRILRQRGRISPKNAAQLGLQIAAGLEYAHAKGIVHRDIKPANLFFTRDKVVKIMDFGLAKMMEEVRRGTTVIGGTPYYMAPEQAAGEAVDARADIYALGVTLYELVTGSVPFTDGDVTYQHRHAAIPDPRTRAPDLPAAFAEFLLHMLEKQVDHRVATAGLVEKQLRQLIR